VSPFRLPGVNDREGFVTAVRARLAGEREPALSSIVEELRAEEIAQLMRGLGDAEVFDAWELLHAELPDLAVEVLPLLDAHDVSRVVDELPAERVAEVLDELPAEDAVHVIEHVDEDRVEDVVAAMEPREGAELEKRLEYPEGSAGRFMSGQFIALREAATAADAVRRVQEASDEVTVVYVYLVDEAGRMTGVVSLRRLLQVKPDRRLSELSPESVTSVSVLDDQEHVAHVAAQHDFVVIPVLDERQRLAGVITHDDVVDVMREEATEDILAMAGTTRDDVISESVLKSARLRMPWLFACLLGEMLGMKVLHHSEAKLGDLFLALALFTPAIVAMGGNVGTQAATIVVRGLATGRIQKHDSVPVFWRELRTAALMASIYGVVLAASAWLILDKPPMFCVTVGAGLLCSMTLASAFGTLVPIAFHAAKIDPAVATGPLVTTAMDVLGIGTYLTLASWLLLG